MLIILKGVSSLTRILPDGTGEGRNGGEEVYPIHRKKRESHDITKTFAKAAWFRYVDSVTVGRSTMSYRRSKRNVGC